MTDHESRTLEVLTSIDETLAKLFVCFEDQYDLAVAKRREKKISYLKSILSEKRKEILKLLIDQPELSQMEISRQLGVSQPAVSKFLVLLTENGIMSIGPDGKRSITDTSGIHDLISSL